MTEQEREEARQLAERGLQWQAAASVTEQFCSEYRERIISELETGQAQDAAGALVMLKLIKVFRQTMLSYIQQGEYAAKELREDEQQ